MGFWATFSLVEKIFALSAGFGSLFFVLRAVSLIFGVTGNSGADLDGDGIPDALESSGGLSDLDGDGIPDVLEHSGVSISSLIDSDGDGIPDVIEGDGNLPEKVPFFKKFLSLQNLSAFVMMFGFVGLAMTRSSGFGAIPAIIAGVIAGFIASWIFFIMNNSLMKLSQCGTARITSSVGKVGRVYLSIPANSDGQVEVEVDGRLKVCDAISADNTEIKTDTKILVIDIKENDEGKELLVVKEYKQ